MSRNWMDVYVTRVTGVHFEKEEVYKFLNALISDLNRKLKAENLPLAEVDVEENVIKFPDCLVVVDIQDKKVTFKKHKDSGYKGESSIMEEDFSYRVKRNSGSHAEVETLEEAIKEAIEVVLVRLSS